MDDGVIPNPRPNRPARIMGACAIQTIQNRPAKKSRNTKA